MPGPVALLVVDNENPRFDRDLLDNLKQHGICDVHLCADLFKIKKTGHPSPNYIKERIAHIEALKAQLNRAGIQVHQVLTPEDFFWAAIEEEESIQDSGFHDLYDASYKRMVLGHPQYEDATVFLGKFGSSKRRVWGRAYAAMQEAISPELLSLMRASLYKAKACYDVFLEYKTASGAEEDTLSYLFTHYLDDHPREKTLIITQKAYPAHANNPLLINMIKNNPKKLSEASETLYKKEWSDLNLALAFRKRNESLSSKEKMFLEQAERAMETIGTLKASAKSADLPDLLQAVRLIHALSNAADYPEKTLENARALATLSEKLFEKHGAWTVLGNTLLTLACSALVVAGILAAIPTGGSSLLLAAIGSAGLTATVTAGAGVVMAGLSGAAARYYGREREETKTLRFFTKTATELHAEDSPFVLPESVIRAEELNTWNWKACERVIIDDPSRNIDFSTDAFKYMLLKNVPGNKQEALKTLTTLIQKGLLTPASTLSAEFMKKIGYDEHLVSTFYDPFSAQVVLWQDNLPRRECHIRTTANGFIVQEIVTYYQLEQQFEVNDDEYETKTVNPDGNQTYVYKAQMTLEVRFSACNTECYVSTLSNTISYGNQQVAANMREAAIAESSSHSSACK